MKPVFARRQRRIPAAVALTLLAAWLPITFAAEPTNGPLVALGLTNVPIGGTALEVIEGGILFVHDTGENGSGVSVQLGEADSGVFLYPLTGYLYQGHTLEGKAYGRVNGVTNQFISSVVGMHNGDQSAIVTADFSPLGASRLSVFANGMLLGQITNSIAVIRVRGDGNGCRANPWWRLPDGSFGALIELAQAEALISFPPEAEDQTVEGRSIFIRPDDPTNSVEFVSRVDVTATNISSFCLTDARVGVFFHAHKALGQATLHPAPGQLTIGTLVSNIQDGVMVELPDVSSFDVNVAPLELSGSNAIIQISGYGTGGAEWAELGTTRIQNSNGTVQVRMETPLAPQIEIQVRSNGVVTGSVIVPHSDAVVGLSGSPRITGWTLLARTMQTPPGFSVRVDHLTTFMASGGATFVGDEVRMLIAEPVFLESLASVVMVASELPSFTITGENTTTAPAPELTIARSTNGVTLSWPDPNRIYVLEAATAFSEGFIALEGEPDFADNHCRLTVNVEGNDGRFFRLRRRAPYSD